MNHCGTIPLTTGKLLLRRFSPQDRKAMQQYWVSDPLVQSMYSEPVYTSDAEVDGLIARYMNAYEDQSYYRWAVVHEDTQECIGQIAIFLVNTVNRFCEIEYCIGRPFQKQGLATQATRAVIDFAFNTVGFHRVQICHKANNPASRRVIEKSGCTYEGTLRDYFLIDGTYVSRLYYSVLAHEWNNVQTHG